MDFWKIIWATFSSTIKSVESQGFKPIPALKRSSKRYMALSWYRALQRATLCLCPPLSFSPFLPTSKKVILPPIQQIIIPNSIPSGICFKSSQRSDKTKHSLKNFSSKGFPKQTFSFISNYFLIGINRRAQKYQFRSLLELKNLGAKEVAKRRQYFHLLATNEFFPGYPIILFENIISKQTGKTLNSPRMLSKKAVFPVPTFP